MPHQDAREAADERQSEDRAHDSALQALADLVAAAEQMVGVCALIRAHAAEIRACRQEGLPYRDIVHRESRPLIAEVLTDATARFEGAGTRFRQAKAAALRAEGMTLEEIGAFFGLSRQRISRLLQDAAHPASGSGR